MRHGWLCVRQGKVIKPTLCSACSCTIPAQMAINRGRVSNLIQRVFLDMPDQSKRADTKRALEADMRIYLAVRAHLRHCPCWCCS